MSSGKRHSNERYGSKEPKPKEVPHAGLVMLKADGSNLVTWAAALNGHIEASWGTYGAAIAGGKLLVRAVPTAEQIEIEFPGLTQANIQKQLLDDVSQYRRQTKKDLESKTEIYALMKQVTSYDGMSRVENLPGYAAAEAARDPCSLYTLIRSEHSLRTNNMSTREAKHVAEKKYWTLKQQHRQSDSEFADQFRLCVANMATLECTTKPTAEEQAMHFLTCLNQKEHGEYMRDAVNRERATAGTIPKTVAGVMEAARMYIPAPTRGHLSSEAARQAMVYTSSSVSEAKKTKPCANCGELGHWARECEKPDSRLEDGGTAKNNLKGGDKSKKKTGKNNDVKAVFHAENDVERCDLSDEDSDDDILGHRGYVTQVYALKIPKTRRSDTFTIDSFADESFVLGEKHLDDGIDEQTAVKGIHGVEHLKRRGTLPGIGPCIVSPGGGVNGIALCQLEARYKVVYNQNVDFRVYVSDDLTLIFSKASGANAYSCVIDSDMFNKLREAQPRINYAMITTVSQREAEHTKREVARAQEAKTMRRRLFYPADGALVRTLHKGVLTNCDVTGRDVTVATSIYGRDIPSIKGKTKDKGPTGDRLMHVPVMDRKEQRVYADVFHWQGESFVLFVVKPLRLLMIEHMQKPNLTHVCKAVETLCSKIEARGYLVTELVADPGGEFKGMLGRVRQNVTIVGSRTHVADIEVEIRTVKERMRCTEAGLPYKVCKRMIKWLAYGCVHAYNVVLRVGQDVSARELFTGIKADYKRDYRAEFGEYVQAHVPPANIDRSGNKPRSVGAIALCPTGNYKGTYWFLSMRTGRVFMADRWTALPMSDLVIDAMNKMHDSDGGRGNGCNRRTARAQDASDSTDVTAEGVVMPTMREDTGDITDSVPLGAVDTTEEDTDNTHEYEDTANNMHVRSRGEEHVSSRGEENPMFSSSYDDRDEEENIAPVTTENSHNRERRSERIATGDHFTEHAIHIFTAVVTEKLKTHANMCPIRVVSILRLTVKKALAKDHNATVTSIVKEFKQLLDKNVWTVLRREGLTYKQLKDSIRSSMFLKEKFDASGNFEKLKARLVAGGNEQDKTVYDQLSCPTITQEAIMMVLSVAASEKRKIRTIDITGAYLECDMTDQVEVIMKLDPLLTKILQQVDSSLKGTEDDRGITYVRLNKALYGTVQAAVLWYNKLKSVLMCDGYTANPYDACLFNKTVGGAQISIAFHVDDLLVTSVDESLMDALEAHLNGNFTSITVCNGSQHSYLAMNIVLSSEGITVDMSAYIDKCTGERNFGRKATSPARDDLFEEPEDSELLGEVDKAEFHSTVARLLYLAKRVRVECLCAVSHLSSRVARPTVDDKKKLERILNFLSHTRERKLTYRWGSQVTLEAYIDASFGGHADCRSRTGVMLMMSGGCVGAWSAKQKLNTKSSTEAEIVGLSDGLSHVIWARELLLAQGYCLPPTKIHQDNQGVLSIMGGGRSPKHRTKHLDIRHFFVRDRVSRGDVTLCYCPTREMLADVLTKAINGELFQYLISQLG